MKIGQYKQKGHKHTPIISVTIGLSVSLLMSFLLSAVAAYLVAGEHLSQGSIGNITVLIQFVGALTGCITAAILSGKMPAIITSVCAGGYFALMICTNILVLDSSLSGVGKGLLAIFAGAVLSVVAILLGKKNGKRKKIRAR